MSKKKQGLIPPDKERCQAAPNMLRQTFVTLGIHKPVRCENAPSVIVTEKKAASDGLRGSMSLCNDCLALFRKTYGEDYAEEKLILAEKKPAV